MITTNWLLEGVFVNEPSISMSKFRVHHTLKAFSVAFMSLSHVCMHTRRNHLQFCIAPAHVWQIYFVPHPIVHTALDWVSRPLGVVVLRITDALLALIRSPSVPSFHRFKAKKNLLRSLAYLKPVVETFAPKRQQSGPFVHSTEISAVGGFLNAFDVVAITDATGISSGAPLSPSYIIWHFYTAYRVIFYLLALLVKICHASTKSVASHFLGWNPRSACAVIFSDHLVQKIELNFGEVKVVKCVVPATLARFNIQRNTMCLVQIFSFVPSRYVAIHISSQTTVPNSLSKVL